MIGPHACVTRQFLFPAQPIDQAGRRWPNGDSISIGRRVDLGQVPKARSDQAGEIQGERLRSHRPTDDGLVVLQRDINTGAVFRRPAVEATRSPVALRA